VDFTVNKTFNSMGVCLSVYFYEILYIYDPPVVMLVQYAKTSVVM